ncbi:fimbrial protein [Enterobacter roggenkampii]|uniref:fimbrial protein n=1 Tax=Enterobacter roggenkampii TaxID=1812935 RepID=UPI002004CA89|nr:fimbrial protein [Enterobacter roggenkampii]MCK6933105.1 fimbrial protein [Enterobacter roggenkampii]MDL0017520.1 fimbrial protein [Enterobacter roggenkampii]
MNKPSKKTVSRTILAVIFVVTEFFMPCIVKADTGDRYTLDINISGTVVANGSCSFNQGGTLNINFGTVKLENTGNSTVQLEGDYQRELASDFFCSGDTAGLLQMQFSSADGQYETYNGTKVLNTSRGIVAIQLLVNGAPQNMGTWFDVDPASTQNLHAQLVQISTANTTGVTSGDTFTASGTLTLAFN